MAVNALLFKSRRRNFPEASVSACIFYYMSVVGPANVEAELSLKL